MMPARLHWILLLSSVAVAACVPVSVTYLRPSAPGAEYRRSGCGETAGPKDRAVLPGPEGCTIRVDGYSLEELSRLQKGSRGDRTGIGITIVVQTPIDQPVPLRFVSPSFFLKDEDTGSIHEYQAEHALDFEDVEVKLDGIVAALKSIGSGDDRVKVRRLGILEPLPAIPPKKKWFRTTSRPYYIVLFFENVRSEKFSLRIPQVSIGATSFEFPEIGFRLVEEWIVVPFNC